MFSFSDRMKEWKEHIESPHSHPTTPNTLNLGPLVRWVLVKGIQKKVAIYGTFLKDFHLFFFFSAGMEKTDQVQKVKLLSESLEDAKHQRRIVEQPSRSWNS